MKDQDENLKPRDVFKNREQERTNLMCDYN